jgi:hypothetical protein
MVAGEPYGARLRPFIPLLFNKDHYCSYTHVLEITSEHAVTVKVDFAAIPGFDVAKPLISVQPANTPARQSFVGFYVCALPARIILQAASSKIEGFADGHLGVLVGLSHFAALDALFRLGLFLA